MSNNKAQQERYGHLRAMAGLIWHLGELKGKKDIPEPYRVKLKDQHAACLYAQKLILNAIERSDLHITRNEEAEKKVKNEYGQERIDS